MAELSQLPDTVNLKFVAGDTFRIRVRVIDPSTSEPVTLTGYEIAAWIAKDDGHTNVADFDVADDPDATNEALILTLPPDETELLFTSRPPGATEFSGKWDLEVTFPNGDVRTVAKGDVHCYDDITNSGVAPPS
jgi:hypothetical protein